MSEKVTNRNRAVLDAATLLAVQKGYRNFTRRDVASVAGVAVGSVNNAFVTMDGLRDAVVAAAVASGNLAIVGQALADRHPAALAAPDDLKESAARSLAA